MCACVYNLLDLQELHVHTVCICRNMYETDWEEEAENTRIRYFFWTLWWVGEWRKVTRPDEEAWWGGCSGTRHWYCPIMILLKNPKANPATSLMTDCAEFHVRNSDPNAPISCISNPVVPPLFYQKSPILNPRTHNCARSPVPNNIQVYASFYTH